MMKLKKPITFAIISDGVVDGSVSIVLTAFEETTPEQARAEHGYDPFFRLWIAAKNQFEEPGSEFYSKAAVHAHDMDVDNLAAYLKWLKADFDACFKPARGGPRPYCATVEAMQKYVIAEYDFDQDYAEELREILEG